MNIVPLPNMLVKDFAMIFGADKDTQLVVGREENHARETRRRIKAETEEKMKMGWYHDALMRGGGL